MGFRDGGVDRSRDKGGVRSLTGYERWTLTAMFFFMCYLMHASLSL